MATALKIPDISFRMGSGRYIQEDGAINLLGEEIARLKCKRPFIIGGKTALSLTADKINASLCKAGMNAVIKRYDGFCCKETNAGILNSDEIKACDIIVGVGGGNIMDAAKHLAVHTGYPVINIPTSSATCAAYTPLSVCYTKEGRTVGTEHYKIEVNCVLADMEVLSKQSVRLFLAGVYDSIAKIYELRQRMLGTNEDDCDIGLLSSYKMSGFAAEFLKTHLDRACDDIKNQRNTKTVYDVVYVAIALTGVISGLARGSNQTAIAHKIYETSRKLFPAEVYSALHGELVAIGLIAQLYFNGEGGDEQFVSTMKKLGMKTRLREFGIKNTDETLNSYYETMLTTSAMRGTTEKEHDKLKAALKIIL